MSDTIPSGGRLSTMAAAFVVARRDFVASLWSRSFFFFLLGPLVPVLVGGLAGSVGNKVEQASAQPVIGIIMQARDADAMMDAAASLSPHLAGALPELVVVQRLSTGETADPNAALKAGMGAVQAKDRNLAAIVSGSPRAPVLTGTAGAIDQWQGPVSLLAAKALGAGPSAFPPVALSATASSTAHEQHGRLLTAQSAQLMLFLLTMMLAGMVLSNLVEEKGNKIIEVLAAAIPMDAVFFGKLFAMLAVSLVGIAVWGSVGAAIMWAGGRTLHELAEPAVGWPLFFALGVIYFAMAYLLLGSLFLSIGSLATTVREVQMMSMPVTMAQLLLMFFATYAMTQPGSKVELAASVFPLSSPYAMMARAAVSADIWPHLAALGWQGLCVVVFVRGGARLFRARVMKSGPSGAAKPQRKQPG